ncbi:MAG: hypothetical protein U0176_08710 [Bacteroidia bacterium]
MALRKSIHWILFLGLILAWTGCRLDDDSKYAIRTYSSFLLVRLPSGELSLQRYDMDAHTMESSWNSKVDVSDADLSDAWMVDNQVWISSANQRALLVVSPAFGSVKERFGDLPIAPHHFAVGDKQILIADTVAGSVAFVKRKNGDTQVVDFQGKPGVCLYNSNKFFLQKDDSLVVVYDETALTPRATLSNGLAIDYLQLNRYNAPVLMSHDSSRIYRANVDPNADVIIGGRFPVYYSDLRATPYFAARFGTEYLMDLSLLNGNLIDETGTILADTITGFDADFFEGTVFYSRGADLVLRRLKDLSLVDSLPFQGALVRSFHQYAAE